MTLHDNRPLGFAPEGDRMDLAEAERTMLTAIVDLACHLVQGTRAWLTLPVRGSQYLRVVATSSPLPSRDDTHGPVLRSGESIDYAGTDRLGSFMSVPILLEGLGHGILNVKGRKSGPGFHSSDRAMLQAFAGLIAPHLAVTPGRPHALPAREDRHEFTAQLIQAQEDERQRLSRELHDEAGHTLTMAIMRLDLELRQLALAATEARSALTSARASLTECAEGLHEIAFALRPRILEDLGLPAALRSLARRVSLPLALEVEVEVVGEPQAVSDALALTMFRAVQEALTNVRKHSAAAWACVVLEYSPSWVRIRVDDDGIGLPYRDGPLDRAKPARVAQGLGLAGMRERVALFGGTFAVGVRPGGGTRLQIAFPLESAIEGGEDGWGADPGLADRGPRRGAGGREAAPRR